MNSKTNTPTKFVLQWLPNYEDRLPVWLRGARFRTVDEFIIVHFNEALEAFAKAQRQALIPALQDCWCCNFDINAILNAPMPKPNINKNKN